ncbi:DUF6153 family protein [Streptomyces sp. JB150]|uniref:DUF6153 family protein n=1 Tax=Streptomyces sp. JB150 TaxID=2714844 RepID=UPI00140C4D33|nr:DUF6153 family protein [Streptomyces sp. JB150]QIJ66233.1 hypothetical protein G7Z13_32625 [Streptomyces sp. JB150]
MRVSRCVRAGGALGQLLLVLVLAVGVFVMHTLGHPREHSGGEHPGSASHGVAAASHVPVSGHAVADHWMSGPSGHPSSAPHEPGMAMDMTSLCVAVLFGAWALAVLLRAAFARRDASLAVLLARVAFVRRPNPPPRGPDLTRLSVLRL